MAYVCTNKMTTQITFANDIIYTHRKCHWEVLLEIIITNPHVRTPADAHKRCHFLMYVFKFFVWLLHMQRVANSVLLFKLRSSQSLPNVH